MVKIFLYVLYYLAMLGAPLSLYIVFPDAGIFDLTSMVPIIITVLMVWQAYNYGKQESKSENEEVRARQKAYLTCLSHAYLIFAPLNFPLIFFLNAWGKSLALIPFLGAAFAGTLFYKAKEKRAAKKAADNTKDNAEDSADDNG